MIRILSWNINKRKTKLKEQILAEIVNENEIDIVVLQEAYGSYIHNSLNAQNTKYEEVLSLGDVGKGVRIFLKKNIFQYALGDKYPRNKLVLVRLKTIKNNEEFNIAAVHLHSKVGNTERQQLWKNFPIFEQIKKFENQPPKNNKTIIVGDFNHNPYEKNLCDPNLINCKDSKSLISILTRNPVNKNAKKDFWYNPMWNLLGDHDFTNKGERVTGTYFRYTTDETPMWNLFDGFIVRPSLMSNIVYNESGIITKSATGSFLKPLITKANESFIYEDISDHLPIKIAITLN